MPPSPSTVDLDHNMFRSLIKELQEELPLGDHRFFLVGYFRSLQANSYEGVHSKEIAKSFNVSESHLSPRDAERKENPHSQLRKDFLEEIHAIEEKLKKTYSYLKIDDYIKTDDGSEYSEGLREIAMRLWDRYAIPWRRKGRLIYLLSIPKDIEGSPVITGNADLAPEIFRFSNLDTFIAMIWHRLAQGVADDNRDKGNFSKEIGTYQKVIATMISLFFLGLIFGWFS